MNKITKTSGQDSVTLVLKAHGRTSIDNAHIFKSANDAVKYVREHTGYETKCTDNFNPDLFIYAAQAETEETEHDGRQLKTYTWLVKREFCVFSFGAKAAIRVRVIKYPMLDTEGNYAEDESAVHTVSRYSDYDRYEWVSPEEYKTNMDLYYEVSSMMSVNGESGE